MNRATPALLALLLVCSLVAVPALAVESGTGVERGEVSAADGPVEYAPLHNVAPIETDNTTNRLGLPGEITSVYTEHGTDLGATLASTDDELRIDYGRYTVIDSEFAAASHDEREDMVRAAYSLIRERTDALEQREREAVRAHADGEISDTELLQTLVRNHNEASVLEDALDELDTERTDAIPEYALSHQQVRADRALLEIHQTPLRSILEQASQSTVSDESVDVRIQTSQDGYSLSTIDGDTYVLETTRFDNRAADEANEFDDLSNSETMDYATDHYPWAGGEQGWSGFNDYGEENLYFVEMEVDQDHLEVYLDGGSGEVYHERQELSLESLPELETESWAGDDLELALTRTPADGPAHVEVVDTPTGEPVTGASVSIDGTEVGETDDDGTLWIVPPAGEYELDVTTPAGSVNATVPSD